MYWVALAWTGTKEAKSQSLASTAKNEAYKVCYCIKSQIREESLPQLLNLMPMMSLGAKAHL